MNTSKKQKTVLAAGALIVSILPIICDGENCKPIPEPDLQEGLPYHFYNITSISVLSDTTTVVSGQDR